MIRLVRGVEVESVREREVLNMSNWSEGQKFVTLFTMWNCAFEYAKSVSLVRGKRAVAMLLGS